MATLNQIALTVITVISFLQNVTLILRCQRRPTGISTLSAMNLDRPHSQNNSVYFLGMELSLHKNAYGVVHLFLRL